MKLNLLIARKYFFSKKISGVVHVISGISILGVVVGTAALIVILSVFNGFEKLVVSLYNSFDPDIKIQLDKGKYFESDSEKIQRLKSVPGVWFLSEIIEENTLARYDENQTFAKIKGLDPAFLPTVGLDSTVFIGDPVIEKGNFPYALLGMGVSGKLGVNVSNDFRHLQLFIPKADKKVILNPRRAFNKATIRPSGIFSIQRDFDDSYILAPLAFVEELTGKKNQRTAIEINLHSEDDLDDIKEQMRQIMGEEFVILDRFEQHQFLHKILKSEKGAVYLILTFVLLIAAFNLIASLTMLSFEKKKDTAILVSMGMTRKNIRGIFLLQGQLLSLGGAFVGLLLGALICLLQENYGLVKIGGSSFVTDAYPVSLAWEDCLVVFITVVIIGFFASFIPANNAARNIQLQDLQSR